MRAFLSRYRLVARGSWRSWSLLALVCGLAASLPIAVAANARRTDSVLPRLIAGSRAADAFVSVNRALPGGVDIDRFFGEVNSLPGIEAAGTVSGVFISQMAPDGSIDPSLQVGTGVGRLMDDAAIDIGRFRVLSGRLPAPGSAGEVAVNPELLAVTGYRVGDQVDDLRLFRLSDFDENLEPDPSKGTPLSLTIVGEVRRPEDVLVEPADRAPGIYLFPAFAAKYPDAAGYVNDYVRLGGGTDAVDTFRDEVIAISAKYTSDQPVISSFADGLDAAQTALRPQIVASWLLCLVLGVVSMVIAAQAIGRRLFETSRGFHVLHALGTTRSGLLAFGLLQAATMAIAAAVVAPIIAFATSALTPLGSSHDVDPSSGLRLDGPVLVLGAVATFIVLIAVSIVPAWRLANAGGSPASTRRIGQPTKPSRLASLLADGGLGPVAVTGARFALQTGRGRSATPVRGVLATVGLAIAVLAAGLAFHADLDRLVRVPRLHGWDWDVAVENRFGSIPNEAVDAVRQRPEVADLAAITIGSLSVGGLRVPAVGIDQLDGTVFPTLDDGRVPVSADEIVLGELTLRALNRAVGDSVEVVTASGTQPMHIVGRATFPSIGSARFSGTGAGTGAAVVVANLPAPADDFQGTYSGVFMRLDRSLDRDAAVASLRAFLADVGCTDADCLIADSLPITFTGYPRLGALVTPFIVVLELMFAVAVTHGILSSIAFRRREMWILSAIGLDRRQSKEILLWQALTIALTALVAGLVVGITAANLLWRAFTHRVGITTAISVPYGRLGLMCATTVAGALVIALAAAPLIGRRAGEDGPVLDQS